VIDILSSHSQKFESSHLHTQRNFHEFISNQHSAGLTDLIKEINLKKRNGPIGADLGGSGMGRPN
jgi:hypothetical protein